MGKTTKSVSPSFSSDEVSRRRRRRRHRDTSDDGDSDDDHRRSRKREKEGDKEKSRRKSSTPARKERRGRERDRGERKHRKESKRKSRRESKRRVSDSDEESVSGSSEEEYSERERSRAGKPESVVRGLLEEFPGVSADLKQLLQMIDNGQAVDIKGISQRPLMKHLKMLFLSLNLKEKGDRVFLLRSNARPTLEIVGPMITSNTEAPDQQTADTLSPQPDADVENVGDDLPSVTVGPTCGTSVPRKRVIGPEMPSAELLAAAAKLTEAEAALREAELEQDNEMFIGPPPPAIVTEAASSNEAERFEEVARIMGIEGNSPYDVVGVNHKMPIENIKKRYWKLSLMVHPDKCPHPQAQQAFVKLNKAFKDLQDPDKRKAMDESIKKKEEEEETRAELRSMREAAQWRRLQGISMEGDDVLLAELEVKGPPRRDEWMTTLPPERKPGGMPTHSTSFSQTAKEGRGDTTAWTDTPSERSQKAKMNYLEAYNQATALASNEENKKTNNNDAHLVDEYNKAKRSKSLVEKHKEELERSRSKKKAKRKVEAGEEGDWVGNHPWKPWDREKDISAGRLNVKLDPENMGQGLTSRFSSGNIQRSFL